MTKSSAFAFSVGSVSERSLGRVESCIRCPHRCYSIATFNGQIHSIRKIRHGDLQNSGNLVSGSTGGIGCKCTRIEPINVCSRFGDVAICVLGSMGTRHRERMKNWLTSMGHIFISSNAGALSAQLVSALISRRHNIIFGIKSALRDVQGNFVVLALAQEKVYVALSTSSSGLWVHKGRNRVVVCGSKNNSGQCFGHASRLNPGEIFVLEKGHIKPIERFVR